VFPAEKRGGHECCRRDDLVREEIPPQEAVVGQDVGEHVPEDVGVLLWRPFGELFEKVQGTVAAERPGSERTHVTLSSEDSHSWRQRAPRHKILCSVAL